MQEIYKNNILCYHGIRVKPWYRGICIHVLVLCNIQVNRMFVSALLYDAVVYWCLDV